jgi:adenine-specific DNA methylase
LKKQQRDAFAPQTVHKDLEKQKKSSTFAYFKQGFMDEIELKIRQLREELELHNHRYYVLSAPIISDKTFDEMMKELQSLEEHCLLFG